MGIPTHTDTPVWRDTLRQVFGAKAILLQWGRAWEREKRGKEDTPDWRDPLRCFLGRFVVMRKGMDRGKGKKKEEKK